MHGAAHAGGAAVLVPRPPRNGLGDRAQIAVPQVALGMASSPEIVVGLIEGQQAVIERLEGAVTRLADDAVREEAAGVEQRAVARLSCLLRYVAAPALGQIDVFRQLAQRVLVGVDLPGPPERMTWCFGDGAAVIGQI